MSDIKLTAFLYSEYSNYANEFMQVASNLPPQLQAQLRPVYLSVDTEAIRSMIKNSLSITVRSVPCVLILYTDGVVEKYEGDTAFTWLEELLTPLEQPEIEPVPDPRLGEMERKLAEMEQLLRNAQAPQQEPVPRRRQPKPVREPEQPKATSISTLPDISEVGEYDEEEDDPVLEGQVSSVTAMQAKQEAIHSSAAELQKERDQMEAEIAMRRRIVA